MEFVTKSLRDSKDSRLGLRDASHSAGPQASCHMAHTVQDSRSVFRGPQSCAAPLSATGSTYMIASNIPYETRLAGTGSWQLGLAVTSLLYPAVKVRTHTRPAACVRTVGGQNGDAKTPPRSRNTTRPETVIRSSRKRARRARRRCRSQRRRRGRGSAC